MELKLQVECFFKPITKEELGFKYFIWPKKDITKVNDMRKSVGFKDTIEDLAKSMDVESETLNYNLEEINTISKKLIKLQQIFVNEIRD